MNIILKRRNIISVLLISFIVLLVINSVLTFRNGEIIAENNALKIETETVKRATGGIIGNIVHGADLAVRGFALTKNDKLAEPLKLVLRDKDSVFNNLEVLLVKQHYDTAEFREMKTAVENYLTFSTDMISLARQDSMKQFTELLNEDRGFLVWKKYESFYLPLFQYEDELTIAADQKYADALSQNGIIQLVLMLLGIPSIVYILLKLKSERGERELFIKALDKSNRKYIFDDGASVEVNDWKNIIDDSIKKFQYANEFITKISSGDYAIKWAGIDKSNEHLNQSNLAGRLIKMSSYLEQAKIEDERRHWASLGLAKFAQLVRDQQDFQTLNDDVISNIVKYTGSSQGSLFVLQDDNKDDIHMRLASCYAWDRKKYIEKRFNEGDGLVGQCWYEGDAIYLTQVPSNYISITSGLGQATPRCIFIAPLKVNKITYGVLELASFDPYEQYQRDFITRACEIIASAIANLKVSAHTKHLLEQSQEQADALHRQEMERIQSMEELLATQDEMRRVQQEIEVQTSIINSIAIVSKTDAKGNITFVNDEFCKWSKYTREEVMGKNHRILKSGHQPDEIFKDLWRTIYSGKIWRGEIKNRAKDGSYYWVDAIIAPVLGSNGKPKEFVAQRFVIDDKKEREERMQSILAESQAKTEALQAQEEELRAQQEELRQNMEELQAMLEAEAQRNAHFAHSNPP